MIKITDFHNELAMCLSRWYERCHRNFPWRDTHEPYSVLVSETMLQQTQASRVTEYYLRWMERFPALSSLACATEAEVIGLWQGLGYYSRARSLLRIAQTLAAQGRTTLPDSVPELLRLPGIGPYTAGAICSIAFAQPEPAIDGNVRRLFSRLLDLDCDPSKAAGLAAVECSVRAVLRCGNPSILAQAFMELGATHCRHKFNCTLCPVTHLCRAFVAGTQALRPIHERAATVQRRNAAALILLDTERRIAVRRRPEKNCLWAGFYELPWLTGHEAEPHEACLARFLPTLGCSAGTLPSDTGIAETLRFTRWQVSLHLWSCSVGHDQPTASDLTFLPVSQALALPMPAGMKRALNRFHALHSNPTGGTFNEQHAHP